MLRIEHSESGISTYFNHIIIYKLSYVNLYDEEKCPYSFNYFLRETWDIQRFNAPSLSN